MITGANGFVGSSIAGRAQERGLEVVSVVRRSGTSFVGAEVVADLSRTERTSLIIDEVDPDFVVHAAGSASVADSLTEPMRDFEDSVLCWQQLLEAMRHTRRYRRIVYLSSAAVYGQPDRMPIAEHSSVAPISPYGYHKSICEQLASEYESCFGLDIVCARLFSLMGPAQRRLLVWEIVVQALSQDASDVTLRGTGHETRDYVHSTDMADAVIELGLADLSRLSADQKRINIGSGIETKISDLAREIVDLTAPHKGLVFAGQASGGDPSRWLADVRRLRESLPDWNPRRLESSLLDCITTWRRDDLDVRDSAFHGRLV